MINRTQSHKRKLLRLFLRGYTRFALVVLGVFGVVGILHPGFFVYGMRHLTTVLADDLNVTGLVLPSPAVPVVTSDLSCNPLNLSMALDLDWTADAGGGTFTYDIERNGLPLVSGLSSATTTYLDTSLTVATTYTYVVRANGPMGPGFADSIPHVLTTPYNCDGLTPPTVAVTMFQGNPIDGIDDHGTTRRRQPIVVGASNIPYANIRITINGETRLVADVTANANGYWEWKPTVRLNYERSVMNIIATDPLNANRYAVTALYYQILREHEKEDSRQSGNASPPTSAPSGGSEISQPSSAVDSLEFDFAAGTNQSSFIQGENAATTLILKRFPSALDGQSLRAQYQLVDAKGNGITTSSRDILLQKNQVIKEDIDIPLYVRPGQYSISVTMSINGVLYSKSQVITVQPLPVIQLSSGRDITYDEFIWNLGWIAFIALATVLLWLFLVFYEYWLFMKGKLYVDEWDFRKFGFISSLK